MSEKKLDEEAFEKAAISAKKSTKEKSKKTKDALTRASEKVNRATKKISESVKKTTSERSGKIKLNKDSKTEEIVENKNPKDNIEEKNSILSKPEVEELKLSDIEKIGEEIEERKRIESEDFKLMLKNSFEPFVYGIIFIGYLVFVKFGFKYWPAISYINDLKVFSFIFLGAALFMIEKAYKEDKFSICVSGIEIVLMGLYTLAMPYIYQINFSNFLKIATTIEIIIIVYYLIKSSLAFLNNRNQYYTEKNDFISEDTEDDFDKEFLDDDDD